MWYKKNKINLAAQPLRVCHITSAHPANDIRIFHKECITLVESGYEVHLVATGTLGPDSKGVIHHVLPMKARRGRLSRMIFRSWSAYQLAKTTQATLFHFHDPELLPYGLLLKWQGNVVIYDAHEDLPRDVIVKAWIPRCLRSSIAWLIERFENFIARRLDTVIAATPFICKRFQDIGATAIEVKNFPRLSELNADLSASVAETIPEAAICYVGLISMQRGIIEMITAVEQLNVRLILAGSFVDNKTEKMVRSLPGWANVDFRGTVSRQGIADIFAESTIGLCILHPSTTHIESMPNKLFEYMSAKLPVLSSNFKLWRSIVDTAHCGLCVDPLNMSAIKQALHWLLSNPLDAENMGLRGRCAVEAHYNWEEEAARLVGIYQSLLFNFI